MREKEINGWLEEKCKEYRFISKRIQALKEENELLVNSTLGSAQWALEINRAKINELEEQNEKLKKSILLRYKVNAMKTIDDSVLKSTFSNEELSEAMNKEITVLERRQDANIQKELDDTYQKAANLVLIKAASFIGMSLLAVATFALFTACPPAVLGTGLAITIVVASIYAYRHQQEIVNKMGTLKHSVHSFFTSHSNEELTSKRNDIIREEDLKPDKDENLSID